MASLLSFKTLVQNTIMNIKYIWTFLKSLPIRFDNIQFGIDRCCWSICAELQHVVVAVYTYICYRYVCISLFIIFTHTNQIKISQIRSSPYIYVVIGLQTVHYRHWNMFDCYHRSTWCYSASSWTNLMEFDLIWDVRGDNIYVCSMLYGNDIYGVLLYVQFQSISGRTNG